MLVYIYKNVDNFFFVLGNKFQILAQEHSLNLFITLQFRHMKMENKKKCITTYTMQELQAHPSVKRKYKRGQNKALQVKSYLPGQNCVFLKDDVIPSQFSSFLFAYRRF